MKQLFVDTSAWDALADKADKDHLSAIRFRNEIAGTRKLVTSNYILDELFTLLLMNIGYAPTVQYKARLDILIAEHVLDLVWCPLLSRRSLISDIPSPTPSPLVLTRRHEGTEIFYGLFRSNSSQSS